MLITREEYPKKAVEKQCYSPHSTGDKSLDEEKLEETIDCERKTKSLVRFRTRHDEHSDDSLGVQA
jgi:hypothetical protein